MATVKKSKKKVIIPIIIILVIAIVATSLFIYKKNNSGEKVSLNTISTGDIYENVSATGEITSGASREYKVGSVATVKEVFVKVGDNVKKGDLLATFDTSNIDAQVASLKSTYASSKQAYNDAVAAQKTAKKNLAKVNKQIASIEKQMKKATADSKTTTKTTTKTTVTTTAPTTTTTTTATTTAVKTFTITANVKSGMEAMGNVQVGKNTAGATSTGVYNQGSSVTLSAIPNSGYSFDGWYNAAGEKYRSSSETRVTVASDATYVAVFKTGATSITDIASALQDISNTIKDMTDDYNTMVTIINQTSGAISAQLANGITSPKDISDAVYSAIQKAIADGTIEASKLKMDPDDVAKGVAKAVENINWAKIAKEFTNTSNVKLTTLQIQLAALNAEKELYSVQAKGTTVKSQKQVMDTTKSAMDALSDASKELDQGWTASFDGTITACDIADGDQTSLVSKGITLEDMSSMVVTISLSEYDTHKVKVGMPCTVTTAYGKYDGEVLSKAPVASGGSSGSILDNVGSMAGISGLSSLTDSGAGVECQIKVSNPDENIIVGFDADVEISTGQYLDVVVVPIESIKMEKTGSFVYLYNEKDSTVTKTEIETGAISDSSYQVKKGLKVGDKVVAAPSSTYETDSFKVKIVSSSEMSTTAAAD